MSEYQKKGIIFKTDKYGDVIMCIHTQTAIAFLQTLATNPDGWSRHRIRKFGTPRNGITHGIEQIDIVKEVKPKYPEERK